MKKTKEYKNTKFLPQTLRAARDLIDQQRTNSGNEGKFWILYARTSENEVWNFDSDEEFFAAYLDSISTCYRYERGRNSIDVDFSPKDTTDTVSASTRSEIEAVFNIFEDAASSSLLPVKSALVPKGYSDLSAFESDAPIPSCYVNRKLLEKIELYCVEELPKIVNIGAEIIKENYSVAIVDSSGTERLRTINEYPVDIFPDTVTQIILAVSRVYSSGLYIDLFVRFHRDKNFSTIHVNCKSDNPREIVTGILDGLMRRIRGAKTLSYLYHPADWVDPALGVFGFFAGYIGLTGFAKGHTVAGMICLFIAVLVVIYFTIAKIWNPYTAFDSQAQIRRSSRWKFVLYSFAGFVIFSTILAALRKEILGF